MRKYVIIGCGCFVGAVLRYLADGIRIFYIKGDFPLNTLFINISGAFIMAFLLAEASEVWKFDSDIRLGLTTGTLGSFTTFSTLCREMAGFIYNGYFFSAMLYFSISALLGLGAAYSGIAFARKIVLRKKEECDNF